VSSPHSREEENDRWFAEEVQPHALVLRAWLRRQFPSFYDVDDIVQEASLRVLEAKKNNELRSPKAFLFATARNLVLSHLRHREVERIDPLAEIEALSVMDMDAGAPETVARNEELELLTQAIQSLPKRCRQVFTLRKIYQLSQKEIASELGISEHTVEVQGTIGLRKVAEFFEHHNRLRRDRP
jgi:RNA polymerase sigma-70 factor (ECF subfamily)